MRTAHAVTGYSDSDSDSDKGDPHPQPSVGRWVCTNEVLGGVEAQKGKQGKDTPRV